MQSDRYVLDTWAMLSLIEDEPGADRVADLLGTKAVLLPFVAGLQTYYVTMQERGIDEAERRFSCSASYRYAGWTPSAIGPSR